MFSQGQLQLPFQPEKFPYFPSCIPFAPEHFIDFFHIGLAVCEASGNQLNHPHQKAGCFHRIHGFVGPCQTEASQVQRLSLLMHQGICRVIEKIGLIIGEAAVIYKINGFGKCIVCFPGYPMMKLPRLMMP